MKKLFMCMPREPSFTSSRTFEKFNIGHLFGRLSYLVVCLCGLAVFFQLGALDEKDECKAEFKE